MKTVFRFVLTLATLVCLGLLGACSQPQRGAAQLPDLTIGIAGFTQPTNVLELMAGYIPENQGKATEADIVRIDTDLRSALAKTNRSFTFIESIPTMPTTTGRSDRKGGNTALAHWVDVAKKQGVDLIIVPMVIDWQERQGGNLGVTTSAAITTDIFLIDARGEGNLLQRSFYNEKQTGLSNNLLDMGTFFKRGGKWLTAEQLTQEAIQKAITEFGL